MATVARRHVPVATHHHTDDLTAIIAIGALLWLLGTVFVISWQDSGHRLRGILDEHHDPPAEQHTDTHTARRVRNGG